MWYDYLRGRTSADILFNIILIIKIRAEKMRTPNKQEHVYDGYGFRTNSVALMVESYLHDPEQDQERIRVWEKILTDLSKSTQNHKEVEELLREEVRKGIPEKLRPLVWPKLIVEPLK